MDSKKEKLIAEFIKLSKGKNNEEMIPLFLAFNSKAKDENIKFTKEDVTTIFERLKKDMSSDEAQKAEAMLKMASVL